MSRKNIIRAVGVVLMSVIFSFSYAQEVTINDDFTIEDDGTMRLDNDATVWDDLNVYPDAVKLRGIKDPRYGLFRDDGSDSEGVYLTMFDKDTEEEVFFTVQLPHAYKEGTNLQPHIHWTAVSGTPNGTDVVWGLEYTIVSIGGTYSNTTIIQAASIISSPLITLPASAGQHVISAFPEIDGTGITISAIIACRLFRDATNVDDTFANDVGFLGFDLHYEQDTQGSRLPFIK